MLKSFLLGFLVGFCEAQIIKLRCKADGLVKQAEYLETLVQKIEEHAPKPPTRSAPLN